MILAPKLVASDSGKTGLAIGQIARLVFASRSGNRAFLAFGLQMGIPAILIAWMPTYLNRVYAIEPKKAALMAAGFVLAAGVGILFGGGIADRLSAATRRYRAIVPAGYALICGIALFTAFALPPGPWSLALIAVGAVFAAAHGGSALALLMDVTHPSIRATVTAAAVLGAGLLGLAPGPYLVGVLSDLANLPTALMTVSLIPVVAAALFVWASRYHGSDVAALQGGGSEEIAAGAPNVPLSRAAS